jgi:hypothetical protein
MWQAMFLQPYVKKSGKERNLMASFRNSYETKRMLELWITIFCKHLKDLATWDDCNKDIVCETGTKKLHIF